MQFKDQHTQKTMDHKTQEQHLFARRCIWVNGPIIIGAGPSGLAVAASLKQTGVPFLILERENCIASLWQKKTYHRLNLHLPKQFCQLPDFPFPINFPEYPSRHQFITYLESYVQHFDIRSQILFNESVKLARFDSGCGLWRVSSGNGEYISRWIVVASGENAEKVEPHFDGLKDFFGEEFVHACDYKSGEGYGGKRVLVVGCGNSGMEVSLDLCNHDAMPLMVIRSSVHVLPREVLGKSTFKLAVSMMKWFPLWLVDTILLVLARLILGNIKKYGLIRPSIGPLELKNTQGKTPVLDIGTLHKIRSGHIKIVPGIKRFLRGRVELVNGEILEIDSVILATGYCSNVPSWLKENEFFCENGFPKSPFPKGWKGKSGLYAVGFTRRGISGASLDAVKVANDITNIWKYQTNPKKTTRYRASG